MPTRFDRPYIAASQETNEREHEVSSTLFGTHRMLHAHFRTGLGLEVGERTLNDLRTLYQAAVRQVDASIGRLRAALEANGLAEDTAIILVGDHGEEFLDHGHLAHYPKLYDELIRVPLIIDLPNSSGLRIDQQVSLASIPPTVADLLDVEPHPDWEGRSLAATAASGQQPADEPVVSVTVRGEEVTSQPIPRSLSDGELLVSVRDRDWIYIEHIDSGERELYHRPSDPAQQTDLSGEPDAEQRDVIDRFSERVEEHLTTTLVSDEAEPEADDAVDEDLDARLEALGYK